MRKWIPLIATILGTMMLLIDVTIVNVALPDISASLHASFSDLQWVIDAYALALAALLLGVGSLADGLGHKKVYIIGTIIFAATSLTAGLSDNVPTIIAARAIQGVGAAAMFATTVALLHSTYSGKDRGIAFSAWGATAGAAAGIGTVLGGVLTEYLSWRWIFFVNIPISVITVALSVLAFEESARRATRFDLPGMLTFSLGAGALTFSFIRAGETSWSDALTWISLGVSVVGFVAWFWVEKTAKNPMLPLPLLKKPGISGSMLGAAALAFGAFATSPLLSIWLQSLLHMSAARAGLALFPLSAVAFGTSAVFGRVAHRAKPQWTVGLGVVIVGCGSLLLLLIGSQSHWYDALLGLVVIGIGVGVASPTLVSTATAEVPPQQGGVASGAVNTTRQLGMALGIAITGSIFTSIAGSMGARDSDKFARGIDATFWVAGGVGIVGGLAVMAIFMIGERRSVSTPSREGAPNPKTIEQKPYSHTCCT